MSEPRSHHRAKRDRHAPPAAGDYRSTFFDAPVDPASRLMPGPRLPPSYPFGRDEEQQHGQFHFRCDKERHHIYHAAPLMCLPPAVAQTLEVPDDASWKEFLDSAAVEKSSIAATYSSPPQAVAHGAVEVSRPPRRCLSLSPGSYLLSRAPPDWPLTFYIRIDLGGSFHVYPHVGGTFQSLLEVDNAIDRYLRDHRDPKMCKEQAGVSEVEMVIRSCLYWPDGTRKKCSKSEANARALDQTRRLVQALLDQYNENHNLLGDLAYELKKVLHRQYIFEGYADSGILAYYHLNFTTKKKGGDDGRDIDSLFFVEVTLTQGENEEMVVSCFCMVGPNDNGHCYGCTNNGSVGMKHPNMADAYAGGHLNGFLPFGFNREWSDTDFDEIAEEARIRRLYEDVDAEARIVYELGLLPDPQRATPAEI